MASTGKNHKTNLCEKCIRMKLCKIPNVPYISGNILKKMSMEIGFCLDNSKALVVLRFTES